MRMLLRADETPRNHDVDVLVAKTSENIELIDNRWSAKIDGPLGPKYPSGLDQSDL